MFCCSSPKPAQLVMILQLHCASLQTLKEYLHNVNLSLNSWLYCLLSCIVHDIYISIESMFPLAKVFTAAELIMVGIREFMALVLK